MEHLARIRKLTFYLMISGGINCFALATLLFYITKDRPPTPYYERKPVEEEAQQPPLAMDQSNFQVIQQLRKLPYEKLQALLTQTTLIENGYTQRDMALASMTAFHHFDIKRALGTQWPAIQKRVLVYGNNTQLDKLVIYAGLTEDQYKQIIQFATTELWPFTPQGLFQLIQKEPLKPEPQLAEIFYLTSEFLAVELLFNRSDVQVDKTELLNVLKEGNWALLSKFAQEQKVSQDLSPARRQRFLIEFIKNGSKSAAYLMLKTDGEFAVKKLDDNTIMTMLELLLDRTPASEKFAVLLLKSPRSDSVLRLAGIRLYDYLGEAHPEKWDPQALLVRYLPNYKPPVKPQKKAATNPVPTVPNAIKKERVYVVQEGDSLWKIAKKFKVDIDALKSYNKLKSDFLKPGTTLKIKDEPAKKN